MNLYLNRPAFFYEMENLCRLFFPFESFTHCDGETAPATDPPFARCIFRENERLVVDCCVCALGEERSLTLACALDTPPREQEILMACGLYRLLADLCGFEPPWGILTGVRPAKLYSALEKEFGNEEQARHYMGEHLLVQPSKIALCAQTLSAERQARATDDPAGFSLYVSIPFCPTRCSYCSFVSHSVEKTAKLVPRYVELLREELACIGQTAAALGLRLKSIYFGGGTPTTLSADQLDVLARTIETHFDLSSLLEYTVEAGRPDTVTPEKLRVLQAHGVTRLSINPQTMHDDILQTIGRRHTAAQVLEAYRLARQLGFSAINMDVIAGLPGDTPEGFAETLDRLIDLSPENITVHTLSVKRSARLNAEGDPASYAGAANCVAQMLETANRKLLAADYRPYYLYRQSKMLGNFENVGWSRPGKDCLYNIYMMNELHTVLAAGAGGVSRLKEPRGEQIQRIFNYKYPYEYIERFATVLERKKKIGEFYEQYPIRTPRAVDGSIRENGA